MSKVGGTVPRLIHQTWKDRDVPSSMRAWQESWRRLNPDWQYRLWSDADNDALVAEAYPWLLPTYHALPRGVHRADLARYLIVHRHGGVYVDLDFECLRPLESLLERGGALIGVEPDEHLQNWRSEHGATPVSTEHILCNAFLASPARHPFWLAVARRVQTLVAAGDIQAPIFTSGPFMLSEAWAEYPDREDIRLLPSPLLYPLTNLEAETGRKRADYGEAFAVHHWAGTWIPRGRLKNFLVTAMRHPNRWISGAGRSSYDALRTVKRWLVARLAGSPPAHRPRAYRQRRALAAAETQARILIAVPVKNARAYLPRLLENLQTLSYAPEHLSLAFLESDSDDGSWEYLCDQRQRLESRYRRVHLLQEHFAYRPQRQRYHESEQLARRAIMARSRNLLLERALDDEDWVLWLDADVSWWPPQVVEYLLAEDCAIVAPRCVTPRGDDFDLNTFVEDAELDEEAWRAHVRDGLLQPPRGFGRRYLGDFKKAGRVELDGVGGTMLLIRADIHRRGLIYPERPYRHSIETEGLARMARDMRLRCWGLPDLEIVHPLH